MENTMGTSKQSKSIVESFISFDIKAAAIVMPVLVSAGLWYHSQYFITRDEYNQDRNEDRELAREVRDDLRDIKNHLIKRP